MDARNATRLVVSRRVSRLLATDEAFRAFVGFIAPDGTKPVVVAMLDDKVGVLFEHIERFCPSGANVLIGEATEGHFVNIVARPSHDLTDFGTLDSDCPVHVDSDVAMLLAYLTLRKGETVRCKPTRSYAVDLFEETVPA